MLGRFAFVRLKAAENAFKEGRLDEAFQIVRSEDLRQHRRGQKLLTRLGEAFIERARAHLSNSAFGEALLDLDRSQEACGKMDLIADLRRDIRAKADRAQLKQRFRRDQVNAARQRLDDGSLRAAKELLEPASDSNKEAKHICHQADQRQAQAAAAAAEGRAFFEAGQIDLAVERCLRAKALDSRCPPAVDLDSRIARQMLDRTHSAIREGRLDQAARHLATLGPLGESLPARQEAMQLLELARQAAKAVHRFDLIAAKEAAQRLKLLAPDVSWVNQLIDEVHQADGALTALRTGPLGLALDAVSQVSPDSPTVSLANRNMVESVSTAGAQTPAQGGQLPERLLLIVDGAASFLLLRKDRVSIGRMSSNDPADIPLVSDLSERHAEIGRVDDDYFFSSDRDTEIGGRLVRHKLLADGDQIRLNRRTSLTFRLPSRRSGSAVLDLGDPVRSIRDVRRIVLFDGHASIGCSSSCHMNVPIACQRVLVFERGGKLQARLQKSGNSHPGGDPELTRLLQLGRTIEIGGMRLVLQRPQLGRPTAMS